MRVCVCVRAFVRVSVCWIADCSNISGSSPSANKSVCVCVCVSVCVGECVRETECVCVYACMCVSVQAGSEN